jgi:uncharacterized protein (TIGR00730 family)
MSENDFPPERRIPAPPHPVERRAPLPGARPKSEAEDPEARARVRAIKESAAYREAFADPEFLISDAARGVRLQLDYLKAELHLKAHDVTDTIVVFGSTRLVEPTAAAALLELARCERASRPDDPALAETAAIAEKIAEKSRYYEIAREFGALVGAAPRLPHGGRLAVVTGGGPGAMEAANRGALEAGGKSVGLNISLPREQFPNPYTTPDLSLRFHYFALRKMHFLLRARALVAFPGGYGTLDELFEVLTLAQTRKIAPLPIILVGQRYWRRAIDVDFLVEEGVIEPEDRELFWYAETAQEIWDDILCWCEKSGRPLLRR